MMSKTGITSRRILILVMEATPSVTGMKQKKSVIMQRTPTISLPRRSPGSCCRAPKLTSEGSGGAESFSSEPAQAVGWRRARAASDRRLNVTKPLPAMMPLPALTSAILKCCLDSSTSWSAFLFSSVRKKMLSTSWPVSLWCVGRLSGFFPVFSHFSCASASSAPAASASDARRARSPVFRTTHAASTASRPKVSAKNLWSLSSVRSSSGRLSTRTVVAQGFCILRSHSRRRRRKARCALKRNS
mmetsp:Transcript_54699/g.155631  ORF Transcript_54699/g.155631 Transcript_54699/m.155631 type:complete len:244 (+) Transcript_54699:965-1696(+)